MESRGPVILIMIVFIALGLWWGLTKKLDTSPLRNKTLVIFLNRYPQTSLDVSGAKTWFSRDVSSNIDRMSFNRAHLDITYAGPYVGEIEGTLDKCGPPHTGHSVIIEYGVNRAYRAGIDPSEYNYFVVLRNADFQNDDCGRNDAGIGMWDHTLQYEGGVLQGGIGHSTITWGWDLADAHSPQHPQRSIHEFLHGYGRQTSHTYQLRCFRDSAKTIPETYHYLADEYPTTSPFCRNEGHSYIDIMGASAVLEVNSILKKQYRWLTPKQVATVEGTALIVGKTFTLKPIETAAAPNEIQMIMIPIPGTRKAYVLELRGRQDTWSGMGVYLYLTPNRENLDGEEQYLLFTGTQIASESPAPMSLGDTTIDSKMNLTVTITSVSSAGAVLRVIAPPVVQWK